MSIGYCYEPITKVVLHVEIDNIDKLSWPPGRVGRELVPKQPIVIKLLTDISDLG